MTCGSESECATHYTTAPHRLALIRISNGSPLVTMTTILSCILWILTVRQYNYQYFYYYNYYSLCYVDLSIDLQLDLNDSKLD